MTDGLSHAEISAFAAAFPEPSAARRVLVTAGFPAERHPWGAPDASAFWAEVSQALSNGAVELGRIRLFRAARGRLPGEAAIDPAAAAGELAAGGADAGRADAGRAGLAGLSMPAVWNVPTAPARFVGRADALGRLGEAVSDSPLVAVTGLAGIGKTSLVGEFARTHRENLDVVWWLSGRRPELIHEGMRRLAPALDLPERAEPSAVLARLDRTDLRWMIILDDAPEPAALPAWLRPAESGRVLLTSRDPAWEPFGRTVPVGPMSRPDSITLLAERLPAVDRTAAGQIAELVGGHPFALDQAVRVMSDGAIPAAAYADLLRDDPALMLAEGAVPGRPGVTVATLWDEPIGHLDAEAPAAGHLLRIVAHADEAPLPLRLLTADPELIPNAELRGASDNRLAFLRTVGALDRAGLTHRDGDAVAMHGLVRTAVRAHTAPEQADQIVTALAGMLRAALPDTVTANPDAWPAWREMLPHALAVLDAAQTAPEVTTEVTTTTGSAETDRGAEGTGSATGTWSATGSVPDNPRMAWLAEHTAAYLLEQGDPGHAFPLADRAATAHARLDGPDHPDTLAARETLIRAGLAAGHVDQAGPLAEHNVADRSRILGADHPDTFTSRDSLAQAYQQAGHLDHATAMFQHTLADRTRVLGADHPDTLTSQHNLGGAYDAAGHSDAATQLLDATLTARDRVLGPDHPDTLATEHQLGVAYRRTGSTAEATALFEHTAAARDAILGADHPDALATHHQLGVAYQGAGRPDDATRELDHALTGRERVLGPDHPRTLDSALGLAHTHLDAGQPERALPLLEWTLRGRERILGSDHHETTEVREACAESHVRLGRPSDAVPHLRRVLDRHERVLGPDHPATVNGRDSLAQAYRRAGEFNAARPVLERLLADQRRLHGDGDAATLRTADRLAAVYRATGRVGQAIDLNEGVLAQREQILGRHHPDARTSRDTLAATYREAGRSADAIALQRSALADSLRDIGPFHPDSTRARRALADTLGQTRDDAPPPERPTAPERHFDYGGP
ncbi:FxSxx-COOH system tetratricopeptide repeat protein [Frankia sp. AiPs1]|uniref:FxSxx-COOH system tetratricopeptide repeat protein n=1 Tax=Frankia sp. AiPs1 TaxID=573493 RepID=UPI0020435070|nr:FxSxx-COOH system tetratricopeptide repeat protein [Frankia sp. AiPs1]MCM3924133.1 FxSxx-COOH system tetratricopeptide repeat protein [Frankia sp. AiPs1]